MIILVFILFLLGAVFNRTPKGVAACGLFGYSGKDPVDLLRLRFLAAENQLRGDHSTGVYGNHLYKKAKEAKDFVLDQEFEDAIVDAFTVIGHTRQATSGAKTDANAHPFEIYKTQKHGDPSVVGTHNGMLFEYTVKQLCKKYELKEPNVDSELIYQLMVFNNFDYNKTLSDIEGAMALAFVRPDYPEYLHLYHRLSRPLHVGFIDGNLWYSSEDKPLHLIGCQTIESLAIDNLYIFKKGGLVEVSPVKKSQITTIREDQGITHWLANSATTEEKTVLGICGVPAKNGKKNVTSQRQLALDRAWGDLVDTTMTKTTETSTTNGGGRNGGFRNGGPLLLPQLEDSIYGYEATKLEDPSRGRYYASGNNNSCYFVFQLLLPTDGVAIPGWLVRLKDNRFISALSVHNGMGVLEIPERLCGGKLRLEIVNPLKLDVVYEVTIDKPVAGRVLEVALTIPFRKKKETDKAGEVEIDFKSSNEFIELCVAESLTKAYTFSEWLEAQCSVQPFNDQVRGLLGISGKSTGGVCRLVIPDRTDESSTTDIRGYLASSEYDEETDILGMDKYTVGINLDEIRNHQSAINKALSSMDGDPYASAQVLSSMEPFLHYLETYFSNRLDIITEIENRNAEEPRYDRED